MRLTRRIYGSGSREPRRLEASLSGGLPRKHRCRAFLDILSSEHDVLHPVLMVSPKAPMDDETSQPDLNPLVSFFKTDNERSTPHSPEHHSCIARGVFNEGFSMQ